FELATGEPIPAGMFIDHVCGNRACVNPNHLRLVTNKQNLEHRTGLDARNKSGFRGVYFDKRWGKWAAGARHNGRLHSAGYHDTPEEAAEAARQLRLK